MLERLGEITLRELLVLAIGLAAGALWVGVLVLFPYLAFVKIGWPPKGGEWVGWVGLIWVWLCFVGASLSELWKNGPTELRNLLDWWRQRSQRSS